MNLKWKSISQYCVLNFIIFALKNVHFISQPIVLYLSVYKVFQKHVEIFIV